jgi:hypothetical protein
LIRIKNGGCEKRMRSARRWGMDLLTVFILGAALATANTLFQGIRSIAYGGETDAEGGA